MASTALEILIKAKNDSDAAFRAVVKNLEATGNQAKKTSVEVAKASTTMDSFSVRAGKLSDAVGKTSTTLARSADAFGLSANAMRTIGDVADVAQLGFDNLSKSAAGFNAASLAVVGAGLAIGTAIGKLAMQFDVVRENAYAAGEAIQNAFGSQHVRSANEMAVATSNWAIEQKKVAQAYEDLLRAQTKGMSAEQMKKFLMPEPEKPIRQRLIEEARAREEADRKSAESAKRAAAERAAAAKRASEEAVRAYAQEVAEEKKLRESLWNAAKKGYADQVAEEKKLRESAWEEKKRLYQEEVDAAREADEARAESYEEMSAEMLDAIERRREAELAAQEDFATAIGMVADIFEDFGLSADSVLVSVVRGFSEGLHAATEFARATNNAQKAMAALGAAQSALNSGSAAGGAMAGAAFGAQFGILGAGIGAVGGALLGFFGKAKKAREEMRQLRDEFVRSAGGMDALKKQAAAAGISLDGLFKQKSAKALADQIDVIKGKLQDWDEAQKILKEGMEEYGLTVADMGSRFAALQLDEQARKMRLFFEAAQASNANMDAVTAGMAEKVMALVAQYQAAGLAIPAALRPILEAMLKNGDLVKENGEAYGSLEEAGFQFAETMEGALSRIGDEINKLMRVLAQGFNIPINFEVSGSPSAPGVPGGPRPPRDEEVPEFAQGGHTGNGSAAFMAKLHPRETVVPDDKMAGFLAQAFAMAGAQMGGGYQPVRISVVQNNREVGQTHAFLSRTRQQRSSPNATRKF